MLLPVMFTAVNVATSMIRVQDASVDAVTGACRVDRVVRMIKDLGPVDMTWNPGKIQDSSVDLRDSVS